MRGEPASVRARTVGILPTLPLGLLVGLLLLPPVFEPLLALDALSGSERITLGALSTAVLALAVAVPSRWLRLPRLVGVCYLAFLLIASLEIGFRAGFRFVGSEETRHHLAAAAQGTYPENLEYRGHPFLQFVGHRDHNSWGFRGPTPRLEKPEGVVRIVSLGDSATLLGYPEPLELYLAGTVDPEGEGRFELLVFALPGYTSAHCLVNLLLNVGDLDPDYLIVRVGGNEATVRGAGREFRSDYSHAYKPFDPPIAHDRQLVRTSVLYRFLTLRLDRPPPWADLGEATIDHERPREAPPWTDLAELEPFRRNLRTMIDVAELRGIRLLLCTEPYSTDPSTEWFAFTHALAQTNDVVREVAAAAASRVLFLDLDAELTGNRNDLFVDTFHLSEDGARLEAERIGRLILDDQQALRTL